jgi:hypothetical protein
MNRMRSSAVLLSCVILSTAPSAQQPTPALDGPHRPFNDALIDHLAGTWAMTGAVRGRPATLTVKADWVLNHQFLRMEMIDVATPPTYQAAVYIGIDNTSERYVAHWLDAFGARFSETLGYGTVSGDVLRFVFEYPDGPFHTTFTRNLDDDTWTIVMHDRGGTAAWQEFAHYRLQRK